MTSRRKRPAFSLLEMVLALAIGMLLLAALYQALNSQVMHAQIGRDIVSEADVARSVMMRIANDVSNQVGAVDPAANPIYPPATVPAQDATNFNVGVRGDATKLTLSVYRVQPGPTVTPGTTPTTDTVSDLRRVCYWLVNSGSEPAGLGRYENKQATASENDSAPSDLPEQDKYVIAREIKSILFEYYDGSSWQATWEGGTLADGTIGSGPPAAIRVTITLRSGNNAAAADNPDAGTTYQHVIALPTANNFAQTLKSM